MRGAKDERRAGPGHAVAVKVRGEEGEVVVAKGGDGNGASDGDEVLEQPPGPPTPCFRPPRDAAQGD